MLRYLTLGLVVILGACSAPIDRLALTPQAATLSLRPLVGSAMVRTVTLPAYAAAEEIAREQPNGLIGTDADVLWADDPERAVTLVLAENLSAILGADVGPEPWPFVGLSDVIVDVRVNQMLARADATFGLSGQYFVGGDGIDFRNSVDRFTYTVPMPDQSARSIANAQSAALMLLSEDIARKLGR